jgi:DNA polymerase-4
MALRLCPEAQVIKGDMEYYSNMSHLVTEIIQEKVPVMEKASVDEFYLDLSGMDKFFGCYQWTTEIAEAVKKNTGYLLVLHCLPIKQFQRLEQVKQSQPVN